jgi:hypothetical protein
LDGCDELCGVVRAGADLAQDPPVLQLRVDPLAGTALAGVRAIDLLLRRGQRSIATGVRVAAVAPLRIATVGPGPW